MDFSSCNILFLQKFLRDRGVSVSKQRKEELILLCREADRIGIELDPDGLLEDKGSIISRKLTVDVDLDLDLVSKEPVKLTLPTLLDTTNNLSVLPKLTEFDVIQHLGKGHSLSELRNHRKLEGFMMYKDGFVLDIQTALYQNQTKFSAVVSKVKPRTNKNDPISGLPFYICWVVFCSHDEKERVHSAHCSCRGGIDGYCRHVAATLFEILHAYDEHTQSSTSNPCLWNRRKSWGYQPGPPTEITALQTSILSPEQNSIFEPNSAEIEFALPIPSSEKFFSGLPVHVF